MQNLMLTITDQIIDLNYVAAIETVDEPTTYTLVRYHLSTGITVSSRHSNRESAITEKWRAYNQMRAGGERYPIGNNSTAPTE